MRDANPNYGREPGNRLTHMHDNAEPEQIKAEIDRTRAAMDHTLDKLTDRLRPSRWVEEAIAALLGPGRKSESVRVNVQGRAMDVGKVCVRHAGRYATRHPIPAAVVAGGIALLAYEQIKGQSVASAVRRGLRRQEKWMDSEHDFERGPTHLPPSRPRGSVTGRPVYGDVGGRMSGEYPASQYPAGADYPGGSQEHTYRESMQERGQACDVRGSHRIEGMRERLSERARDVRERAAYAADRLSHRAGDVRHRAEMMAHSAGDRVRHAGERVSHAASDATHRMSIEAQRARERGEEAVQSHPLAVAGALFGVGLLLGVLVPTTRREDRLFGQESEQFKRSARRMGEDVLERGRHVASATVAAVKDEAQRQGLTKESITERVEEVASVAGDEAKRRAKEEGLMPARKSQEKSQQGEDGSRCEC
ncbi:MAG TPA: DUF3618 domain-containing protein [Phycisphaerales bacterium]|nr:DUF3618 domain-containing protein [Phycisphaerales bacterium]